VFSFSPYAWRAAQLTSEKSRHSLAASLRGIVDELDGPLRRPGASPLNRDGVRPRARLIEALADRLEATEKPVSPAGMLHVRDLLTDGTSALYDRTKADDLPEAVDTIIAILDAC
jgi:hypothetical protein